MTEGLRAAAGARTSAKAESRTIAVQVVARGAAEAAFLRRLQWLVPLVPPKSTDLHDVREQLRTRRVDSLPSKWKLDTRACDPTPADPSATGRRTP